MLLNIDFKKIFNCIFIYEIFLPSIGDACQIKSASKDYWFWIIVKSCWQLEYVTVESGANALNETILRKRRIAAETVTN